MASPEALAAVVTAKYCDALPLYRQVDIFGRGGLSLSRGTLANWCIKAGNLIKPLVKAMQKHLLSEYSLCADETRVQVLDEGDNPSSNSQMWVYRSNEVSEQVVVIYDYQAGLVQRNSSRAIKVTYSATVTVFMTVLKVLLLLAVGHMPDVNTMKH
ncbi:IS66 family transposase [Colwellia sp. MT41]|uniref:IS66 family transposase n=1 Tax=Colwellia sp. MT41 TaxID=58049 RepID=UPI002FF5C55A